MTSLISTAKMTKNKGVTISKSSLSISNRLRSLGGAGRISFREMKRLAKLKNVRAGSANVSKDLGRSGIREAKDSELKEKEGSRESPLFIPTSSDGHPSGQNQVVGELLGFIYPTGE